MSLECRVMLAFVIAAIVFIMFALALELASYILRRRAYRKRVKQRDCEVCRKRWTVACTNCRFDWTTEHKPDFEAKGWDEEWS